MHLQYEFIRRTFCLLKSTTVTKPKANNSWQSVHTYYNITRPQGILTFNMLRKPLYYGGAYDFFQDSMMTFVSGVEIVLTGGFLMRWRVMTSTLRYGSNDPLFFSFFSHLLSLLSSILVNDPLQNSKVACQLFLPSSLVSIISIAIFNNNYNLVL